MQSDESSPNGVDFIDNTNSNSYEEDGAVARLGGEQQYSSYQQENHLIISSENNQFENDDENHNDDGDEENFDKNDENIEGGKQKKHWVRRVFIFVEYPISTWFIMFAELCERFAFYGFKTILSLYLLNYLKFDQDASTSIVHAFVFFAYCKFFKYFNYFNSNF